MEALSHGDHHAVSTEAAAFRSRMAETGRGQTGAGIGHTYHDPEPAPPPSPHKMRVAGSDRHSINGGVDVSVKQKKHFETASHLRSDHVEASFAAHEDGATLAFGAQGDAGSFSVHGGRGKPRKKFAHSSNTTSSDFYLGSHHGPPEGVPPRAAGGSAGYEPPAARAATRRLSTPYDVNESYFDHPLSPGSKLGHDSARYSHQKVLGQEWRAERDATNPIFGTDVRVDEWKAKLKTGNGAAVDPDRNVLTGALREEDVHTHIVVGSSSLGHWHTGVAAGHGKQRNVEVHAAVASAQIAHTEGGIVHAPPPEPESNPEERRGTLYELVEQRLAEARARSATPAHPARVNDSSSLRDVINRGAPTAAEVAASKPGEGSAAAPEADDAASVVPDGTAAGGGGSNGVAKLARRRSATLTTRKQFVATPTKIVDL